jgi:ribonuclease Z
MDLQICFLGTAGAVPTPSRNLSATLLQRGPDQFLVDCGEGTQRQLIREGSGIHDISHVLLTHMHADHYLGLPGLLKTWDLWGRTLPVAVYGPRGLFDFLDVLKRIIGKVHYPLTWHEIRPGEAIVFEDYRWEAISTDHRISSVGYRLVEDPRPGRFDPDRARELGIEPGPDFGRLQRGERVLARDGREVAPDEVMGDMRRGRTVVLTGDTRPSPRVVEAARGADVLVHDATFVEDERERARETHHSTAREAATVALEAGVSRLVLTHSSFRYPGKRILAEAQEVFPDSWMPSDHDRVIIPLPEKGEARFERISRQQGIKGVSAQES